MTLFNDLRKFADFRVQFNIQCAANAPDAALVTAVEAVVRQHNVDCVDVNLKKLEKIVSDYPDRAFAQPILTVLRA